jgi:hypothetical protein
MLLVHGYSKGLSREASLRALNWSLYSSGASSGIGKDAVHALVTDGYTVSGAVPWASCHAEFRACFSHVFALPRCLLV